MSRIRYFFRLYFVTGTIFVILTVLLIRVYSSSRVPEKYDGSQTDKIGPSIKRPWFFEHGTEYPKPWLPSPEEPKPCLLTAPVCHGDRIVNQLMYVPPNYDKSGRVKVIFMAQGFSGWLLSKGRTIFVESKCPVDTCSLSYDDRQFSTADMILYREMIAPLEDSDGNFQMPHPWQVTVFWNMERHLRDPPLLSGTNWTSTYLQDSDITVPYGKWLYYDPLIRQQPQSRNYASGKTKLVAMFVSNCWGSSGRLLYVKQLKGYIKVDIYGDCGQLKCPKKDAAKCLEMLKRDYKFYLAFENSKGSEYITEKFFANALQNDVLPIALGAPIADYERVAPYHSFIHVDSFDSAKQLADYLKLLDGNDELYNSYFQWKGTGEFINTYFWCRLCAVLHAEESLLPHWYPDILDWWYSPEKANQSHKIQASPNP